MKEVHHIYNSLFRFESKTQKNSYPIHKKLKFDGGRILLDFITDKVSIKSGENVLDAGCGTGHTLFYLWQKYQIKGIGISVSEAEIAFAQHENVRLKSTNYLQFQVMDYNENLPGQYDKIFCIESLKHSSNLKGSLCNLINSLSKDGNLIIVDDFILKETASTVKQMKLWQSPAFGTLRQLTDIIQQCGNYDIKMYELTECVPARAISQIRIMKFLVSIALLFTSKSLKRNLKTYMGALLLEKLYQEKLAAYWLLKIKRKNNGNYSRST